MTRSFNRGMLDMRPVSFVCGVSPHAEGSVQVEFGNTKVWVTCSVEERVPPHLLGKGVGWVTAEYGMLPRATQTRTAREAAKGKQGGRTMEIQRLIGRSLRAALDLSLLGTRSLTLDCDVLVADGGTRTASITGGYVYRGTAIAQLVGRYIYGDFGSGTIWSVPASGPFTPTIIARGASISSFGEGADGELYVADLGSGQISKLVPAP